MVRRFLAGASILGLGLFGVPAAATAQFVEFEQNLWGVSASITAGVLPKWNTPQGFRAFYLADEVSLAGSEFQVGVVRGTELGGDSGWSFIRQAIDSGSFVHDTLNDGSARRLTVDLPTTFDGFLYHRYTPFTTIRERVQIGMVIGAGAGWYRGMVADVVTDAEGVATEDRMAANFLSGLAREGESRWIPLPMARFEAAVAGVLGAGFKARFSGGYSLPHGRVFRLGLVYFVGS